MLYGLLLYPVSRMCLRGANWNNAEQAAAAARNLNNERSIRGWSVGVRAACEYTLRQTGAARIAYWLRPVCRVLSEGTAVPTEKSPVKHRRDRVGLVVPVVRDDCPAVIVRKA